MDLFVDNLLQLAFGNNLVTPGAEIHAGLLESQLFNSEVTSLAGNPLRADISSAGVGSASATAETIMNHRRCFVIASSGLERSGLQTAAINKAVRSNRARRRP